MAPSWYGPAPSTVNSTTTADDGGPLGGVDGGVAGPDGAGPLGTEAPRVGARSLDFGCPHAVSDASRAITVLATTTRFTPSVHRTCARLDKAPTATSWTRTPRRQVSPTRRGRPPATPLAYSAMRDTGRRAIATTLLLALLAVAGCASAGSGAAAAPASSAAWQDGMAPSDVVAIQESADQKTLTVQLKLPAGFAGQDCVRNLAGKVFYIDATVVHLRVTADMLTDRRCDDTTRLRS